MWCYSYLVWQASVIYVVFWISDLESHGSSISEAVKAMETSGIVLVVGATGGVGRNVVDLLRKKGPTVHALLLFVDIQEVSFHILRYADTYIVEVKA